MKTYRLLPLLGLLALSSCVQPTPRYHQTSMTNEQWAASERAINRMEDQSFQFRDRERMSHARATEMSTRHNPTHVTNNRTSLWFW